MDEKPKKPELTKKELARRQGRRAENLATTYLIQKGYHILERNWRWQRAEIDIIASKNGALVIIEVKSRSSNTLGEPEEAVTPAKELILIDAAGQYALQAGHEKEVRIDIISILFQGRGYQLKHFEDAVY